VLRDGKEMGWESAYRAKAVDDSGPVSTWTGEIVLRSSGDDLRRWASWDQHLKPYNARRYIDLTSQVAAEASGNGAPASRRQRR